MIALNPFQDSDAYSIRVVPGAKLIAPPAENFFSGISVLETKAHDDAASLYGQSSKIRRAPSGAVPKGDIYLRCDLSVAMLFVGRLTR